MTPAGLTVVIPVTPATAAAAPAAVPRWLDTLAQLRRPFGLALVADGCPPDTLAAFAGRPHVTALTNPGPAGFGACLRAALPHCDQEYVATVGLDYPYTPGDIKQFLDRIEVVDPVMHAAPALVAGCRTGRPVPPAAAVVGRALRVLARVLLGYPLAPPAGWLGVRTHFRAWRAWAYFGNPLADPDCPFQLVRRAALGRFPVQSDGGFVHAEVVAKLTFLTAILDEVALTPKPDPAPACDWADLGRVFRDPLFHTPPAAPPPAPAAAPA